MGENAPGERGGVEEWEVLLPIPGSARNRVKFSAAATSKPTGEEKLSTKGPPREKGEKGPPPRDQGGGSILITRQGRKWIAKKREGERIFSAKGTRDDRRGKRKNERTNDSITSAGTFEGGKKKM